jgi:hypothetical protein
MIASLTAAGVRLRRLAKYGEFSLDHTYVAHLE